MENKQYAVEVLSFRKDDQLATIVTDGVKFKSFEFEVNKDHESLARAIAYLESRGYSIYIE